MHIDRFASTHFRNLEHDPVDFSPRVNLFVGENGHGKTNVLEAIQFFQFGRSFRATRETDLIRFGEPFCRFSVAARTGHGDQEDLAASIEDNGKKRIKRNGEEIGKVTEMIGRYPCVLFGPQDLALVSGYPAERRRYIDAIGSMADRQYLDELRGYRRVMKQRNASFKAGRSQEALGVWTEELIQRGCRVAAGRVTVLEAIRSRLAPHAEALDVKFGIKLEYESELSANRPEEVSCPEHYAARLAAVEYDEIRRGITLVGPHRDDLKISADGHDLRRYGSQGQRRLVAVLLRLAELSYLEEKLREPCVLLLDDLFSELDETVSAQLKRVLAEERQIFVTSPVRITWEGSQEAKTFRLEKGRIFAGAAP